MNGVRPDGYLNPAPRRRPHRVTEFALCGCRYTAAGAAARCAYHAEVARRRSEWAAATLAGHLRRLGAIRLAKQHGGTPAEWLDGTRTPPAAGDSPRL